MLLIGDVQYGMRRSTKILIAFAAPALIAAASIYWYAMYTVASDARQVYSSHVGYKFEKYAFRAKCALTLWKSSDEEGEMNLNYTIPNCYNSPKVAEARWLLDGRIVYLHLIKAGYPYSYEHLGQEINGWIPEIPIKIIYDFRKGTMSATSPSPLWRVADPSSNVQWGFMTEDEFRKAFEELSQLK
jgi:hypothetical protein